MLISLLDSPCPKSLSHKCFSCTDKKSRITIPIFGPSQYSESVSQLSRVPVSRLTILRRTLYLASTPKNSVSSSSSSLKQTFIQLTTLPLASSTLLPWRWRIKRIRRILLSSSKPDSWQQLWWLQGRPGGWLGLNVDSGGSPAAAAASLCLLLLASNRGAGRPPHFKTIFEGTNTNTQI